jgi:hypothetical protein
MFVSAGTFNLYAVKYFTNQEISWAFDNPSQLSARKFNVVDYLASIDDWVRSSSVCKITLDTL